MRAPSRQLRKILDDIDNDSFGIAAEKGIEIGQEIARGMESPFGAALYMALEDLERAAYAGMANTPAWSIFKQIQYRSELRTAQYIKNRLEAYVKNAEGLMENIERLQSGEIVFEGN